MQKDFVRDANPKPLYKAGNLGCIPSYVTDYAIPSVESLDGLTKAAFADPDNFLHPIHEKAATILSGVYLNETGKKDSAEMKRVKSAASVFGVLGDLEKILSELDSETEKSASAVVTPSTSNAYALTVEFEDNKKSQCYPIANDVQIRKSASVLQDDLLTGRIPSDWAYAAAVNLVKSAQEHNLSNDELPRRIRLLGIERLVDIEHAKEAASLRQYDGVDEDGVKLYEEVVKMASEDPSTIEDCIKLWADLDISHGIKYAKTFTPEEAFYAGERLDSLQKMASETVIIKDVLVPVAEFTKLSQELITANFRKEAAATIFSAVTLAAANPADATTKLASLDDENQSEVLRLLIHN